MRKFSESKTLEETFTKGSGVEPNRDNWGSIMFNGLKDVLVDITKAIYLKDTVYIKHNDVTSLCDVVDWFETVFKELDEEQEKGKEADND